MSRAAKETENQKRIFFWNNPDVFNVLSVLKAEGVISVDGNGLPIIGMGASSGGSFVAGLPAVLGAQLIGVVPQISATSVVETRAAVVYAAMARDKGTWRAAHAVCASLARRRGVDFPKEIKTHFEPRGGVGFVSAQHQSVPKDFFSVRIPWFPRDLSELVVAKLSDGGFLDAHAHLIANPRSNHAEWSRLIRRVLENYATNSSSPAVLDTLQPDASPIAEELNVAFGVHEFFSDGADAIIDFIIDYANPK
jgi:hypothetical protein